MNNPATFSGSLSAAIVENLGWVLLHSLWQLALVALIAASVRHAMRRRSASARYAMLMVAMMVMIAMPVATWMCLPHQFSDPLAASALGQDSGLDDAMSSETDASQRARNTMLLRDPENEAPTSGVATASGVSERPSETRSPFVADVPMGLSWSERAEAAVQPWLAWIVVGWRVGVAVCSLRPLLGWHTLRRLKRVGVSPVSDDLLSVMRRVSQRLGLRRTVCVLKSTLAQVPVVVGYLRPVILLPVNLATGLPTEQLEAILAHELAHIRRHDFVVNLLQTLVETFFFYHPAVWWLSHQVRIEREHCCDDLVVASLDNRVDYGRALLAIEERRGRSAVFALGLTDGSLLARVTRIVGPREDANAARLSDRWPVSLVILAGLGVAFVMSMSWNLAAKDDAAKDPRQTAVGPQPEPGAIKAMVVLQIADKPNVPEPKIGNATLPHEDHAVAKAEGAAQAKRPPLEFRIAANLPEDGWEPALPEDWEKRNYRDGRLPAGKNHDAGFAWYPLSQPWRSDAAFVVSRSTPETDQGNELLNLLSDKPEHGMLADGSWSLLEAKVVRGKRNPVPGEELGYAIDVRLDEAGAKRFAELVSSYRDMSLAVVMRGEIVGKLVLKEPSARLVFGGHFTKEWAEELVRQLNGLPPDPLATPVSFYANLVTLQTVFDKVLPALVERTGRKLSLDTDSFKAAGVEFDKIVTLKATDESLRRALKKVLGASNAKLDYRLSDDGQGLVVFAPLGKLPANASAPAKGLEFLAQYPKLHGLSLDMTEPQFLEIVKQQELKTPKTADGDKVQHYITLDDSHTLIVMFDKDAKCSGIQRVRGEGAADEKPDVPVEQVPPEPNAVRDRPSPLEFRVVANLAEGDAEPRVPADFLQRHYPDNTPEGRAAAKDRGFIWIPMAKPRDDGVSLPIEATRGEIRVALLGDTTDTAFLLDGKHRVVQCRAVPDQNQPDSRWLIQVTLDAAAGAAFQRLTQAHLNEQLAVIVDGAIIAAPKIRSEIGTEVAITGNFSRAEADQLVAAILSRNEPSDEDAGEEARTSAISRGVAYLKSQQRNDGSWPQTESHPGGVTALVTAALFQAGVKAEEPPIQNALAYLRKTEPTFIYSVALQTMVFSAASPKDDADLIRKHVAWIENAQATAGEGKGRGGWSYHANPGARADGSCTRFAVLGLHAAANAGFAVERDTWQRVAQYWLNNQKPDGRWGYISEASASPSMTLAGIAGLATASSFLPAESGQVAREAALRRASEAIAKDMPSLAHSTWPFYNLHCLERAGHLNHATQFGDVDWKSFAMRQLIDSQRDDGAWSANAEAIGGNSTETPFIATSFALLVLSGQPQP